MDITTFKQDFIGIFDEAPVDEITTDTVFRKLEEWDSMTALSLIAMLDEKYNISVSGEELQKLNTVQDLYNLVGAKA